MTNKVKCFELGPITQLPEDVRASFNDCVTVFLEGSTILEELYLHEYIQSVDEAISFCQAVSNSECAKNLMKIQLINQDVDESEDLANEFAQIISCSEKLSEFDLSKLGLSAQNVAILLSAFTSSESIRNF